jgi:multiple sugar transport system ATP-binding protein
MIVLDIKNLNKAFGKDALAVKDFSLTVELGDFVVLVGPSGCGKTTTLRMIAGLESADSGSMFLDGVDVANVSPEKRDIAMVFQDYALYPHMTVFENIAFPLILNKVPKYETVQRVEKVCKTLGISELLERKPKQLSGGQKQRVAMGRALIREPKLFLLDEPLSNLDAKLRLQARNEIARIHKELNATIIYVTHDQAEAMTLADKIVVMNQGAIIQEGTPQNLYDDPNNTFVAEFMGMPPINLLEAIVDSDRIQIKGQEIDTVAPEYVKKWSAKSGHKEILIGIHPEALYLGENNTDGFIKLEVNQQYKEELGHETISYYSLLGNRDVRRRSSFRQLDSNEMSTLSFQIEKALFFDGENGLRITYGSRC